MSRREPASSRALPTASTIAKAAAGTSAIVRGDGGDAGAAGAVATGTMRRAIRPTSSGLALPRRAATVRRPWRSIASPSPEAPTVHRGACPLRRAAL